jgi:hypothetical protein
VSHKLFRLRTQRRALGEQADNKQARQARKQDRRTAVLFGSWAVGTQALYNSSCIMSLSISVADPCTGPPAISSQTRRQDDPKTPSTPSGGMSKSRRVPASYVTRLLPRPSCAAFLDCLLSLLLVALVHTARTNPSEGSTSTVGSAIAG